MQFVSVCVFQTTSGTYDVEVAQGQLSMTHSGFNYDSAMTPTVSSISPSSISVAGTEVRSLLHLLFVLRMKANILTRQFAHDRHTQHYYIVFTFYFEVLDKYSI